MKSYIKISIVLYFILHTSYFINAQTNLVISGGNWVNKNSNLVLKDTKFTNNSTFHAGSGMVIVTGDATTAQSEIGGTSQTTFHNVKISKSTNNVSLGQHTTVNSLLLFTSGKIEIGSYNLIIGNNGTIAGQNKDRYVVTNFGGRLTRQVGNTWTAFPVGNATFNPARLKNDGTVDVFSIRVADQFLQNGTSGLNVATNVIPRTWHIDEAVVGGSDVSMRLIWRPLHHNNNGFDANNATVTHYTGGAWQDLGSGTSTSDGSYGSDHQYREASNITSFSPFGARTVSNLPVELLYFYGEKEGQNVRLDWQTATELNNSHFDVEWSTDGINFEKIAQVQGAGTSNDVHFYTSLHLSPALGLNYYRLKQVDFDGKYEYTDVISVGFTEIKNLTFDIFPNPAAHYLKIQSEDLINKTVQIFNVNGQLVKEFTHQSLITNLPITDLPSGAYFIKIGNQVKKLIIEK